MRAEQPGAPVPLCDLKAQLRGLQPDIEAALGRVLASGQVILGPEVQALEREIADYCGTAHGVGCGSGTDAISLALHAIGVGPGDEVVLPPFTFFATAGCVVRCGATPVFADIDPVSFNIDPDAVADKITPRTKALLPVHLFGQCADMAPLWKIAERHGLTIIEDAAQALGSEYQAKRAGSLGGIACLSFYPTKNLGTYGDAGMAVTGDPEWAERMAVLRVHGMKPRYFHQAIGWNARIDALQAAILRVKLPYLEGWIAGRQQAAARYAAMIADAGLTQDLTVPAALPDRRHTYNQYVVRVGGGRRDALVRHLQARQIGCEIYYPLCLHQQQCLAHLGYKPGAFPVSERAAAEVLALPVFPEISAEQQWRVIETCGEFLRRPAITRRAA